MLKLCSIALDQIVYVFLIFRITFELHHVYLFRQLELYLGGNIVSPLVKPFLPFEIVVN